MSEQNANGGEGNTPNTNPDNSEGNAKTTFAPITTQEEFDKRLGKRLYEKEQEFKGFKEYKEKAAKYDEVTEAQKSELQKMQEKAAKYEKEYNDLKQGKDRSELISKVRKEHEIPENMATLLTANTEEELIKQAELIKSNLSKSKKVVVGSDTGKNFDESGKSDSPYSELANSLVGKGE